MAYLHVQPFLLLAVCCTTLYGIVNECSDLDVFSNSMIGYRLNATFLTKRETSITECARLCFSYVRCKSFNFGLHLNDCELNLESQSSGSVVLEEQYGYYYSDIHLWPKELGGNCAQNPCHDRAKCVSVRDGSFVCRYFECSPVSNPENGFVTLTDGFSIHSTAIFSCVQAYKLSGYARLTCHVSGKWSHTEPKCQRRPKAIEHPDFESDWTTMKSQSSTPELTTLTLDHDLGELPVLVDVQVKSINEPNFDFIFPASGSGVRDDDNPETYGNVVYLYNTKSIKVLVPVAANGGTVGHAIYTVSLATSFKKWNDKGTCLEIDHVYQATSSNRVNIRGEPPYWHGPNTQLSDDVQVRVRAWKLTSLPLADYIETDIPIGKQSGTAVETYIEKQHGLGEYPALVVVRVKLGGSTLTDWYIDTVGAHTVAYQPSTYLQNMGVIHGYNNETVRVWATNEGFLIGTADGYNLEASSSQGSLEIYAWKKSTISPFMTSSMYLGQEITPSSTQITVDPGRSIDYTFLKVWVEAITGSNQGYRFPGGGMVAYVPSSTGEPCSYGGLAYAYNGTELHLWRPSTEDNSSGKLICISKYMGTGINNQGDNTGQLLVHLWKI